MGIINWCSKQFRYYVVFSKEAIFIFGLIFVHSFVERALVNVLITYLPGVWDIPKSAQVVNLQEGTSAVLQILFAFASDAYLGRFKMVVYSTVSYIIGLALFWNAAWHRNVEIRTFYLGLVLITLAKSAKEVSLKAFLDDQFISTTEEEEERQNSRSNVWWYSASILGANAAIFVPNQLKRLSMISAIAMVVAYLWFWLGAIFYECNGPTGAKAIFDVLFVIKTAVQKINLPYATIPEQLFKNYKCVIHIAPRISWLRWLDKAPIVMAGKPCTVAQVMEVKYLLGMLPMWTTFLTYSLVYATGSTFFLEQASNINDNFSVTIFSILETVTSFATEYLCDFLFRKIGNEMNRQLIMQGRIGVGMAFSVICCIFAWKNAVHWLYLVEIYAVPSRHMNIFSLTPQFVLLGIMKGLSEEGLQSFFRSQVSQSLRDYGPPIGEYVIGIGKFLSILCILIFRRWFGQDIDSSRLDKYYAMLTLLSFVNLLIYWLVAYWYGDDRFFTEEEDCLSLIEGAQDDIGPLELRSFSDRTPNNLQFISVLTRRTRSLSDNMPNNPPYFGVFRRKTRSLSYKTPNNPSYFGVFRRRTRSFSGPARSITPNRMDDAQEHENEQLPLTKNI